jgi:cytochrome P450
MLLAIFLRQASPDGLARRSLLEQAGGTPVSHPSEEDAVQVEDRADGSGSRLEEFDFHGQALDDIFADYREMHARCPVGHSSKYGGFTFVAKLEDIFAAERNPDVFAVAPSMLLPAFGTAAPMIPIDIDPPAHTAYRRILLPLFTPRKLDELTPGIRQTSRELAETVAARDVADASAQYARAVVTIIFSRLCGFPEKDWPKFDRWVDDIIYERTADPDRAYAAGNAVRGYFDQLLQERRGASPRVDLISVLLDARIEDGRPLTHDELVSYCYLLFVAGLDTTAWAIRAGLWYLARTPDAQVQLRSQPELIPAAAEEFLRTLAPVQAMARTCRADTVVRGQEIRAGERVVLVFGAGNRDPEAFDDPDEIRFDRTKNRHLAFGGGIHRCLGSNLGRRELVIALEEFLATVPIFTAEDPSEPWHGVGPLTLRIQREPGR